MLSEKSNPITGCLNPGDLVRILDEPEQQLTYSAGRIGEVVKMIGCFVVMRVERGYDQREIRACPINLVEKIQ
jgi:hypothetical protein